MADLEFSQADIASLIEKVSTLQPSLTAQELQLLVAIFELAAEHTGPAEAARQPPERPEPTTVDELKQQLLDSYAPDDTHTADGSLHRAAGSGAGAALTYIIHWNPDSIHRTGAHSIHRHSIHRDVEPPEEG
jgi:hypothetical protein